MTFITICLTWVFNVRVTKCNSWFQVSNSIPFLECTTCLAEKAISLWTNIRMSAWTAGVAVDHTHTLTLCFKIKALSTGLYRSAGLTFSNRPLEVINTKILSAGFLTWSPGRNTYRAVFSGGTLKTSSSLPRSCFRIPTSNINKMILTLLLSLAQLGKISTYSIVWGRMCRAWRCLLTARKYS